jgi:formylglycine-generating enzyme required for sulfatase activity/tRNA A-37 threonylcarbamoyl transferase component Bud32
MRSVASFVDQQEVPVRIELGAVLAGRLHVGPLLGQGGMANVYAARDHLRREDVAIKVLREDLCFSAAARDRFLAEARLSCNLAHPNIVRVFDVGVSGDNYYISMERLHGRTLRQRIEAQPEASRRFALEDVTDVIAQLVEALRYAHRYIVHRDLKPENVWVCDDGTVKLMDFGIARAYTTSDLTRTGMSLGTAYYMAPEQRGHSKDVDWRADQYSLGVMMYEMLTGSVPIGAFSPLQRERRDIPKRYARAVMRTMSPRPENRFESLNAMMAELKVPKRRLHVSKTALALISANVLAIGAFGAVVFIDRMGNSKPAAEGATPSQQVAAQPDSPPPVESAPPERTAALVTPQPVEYVTGPPVLPTAVDKGKTPTSSAPKETKPETSDDAVPPPPKAATVDSSERLATQLAAIPSNVRPLFKSILTEMVNIPTGQFRMGDVSGGGEPDETPIRTVRVPSFRLSKYEVTTNQYDEYLRSTGKAVPQGARLERRPIVEVSWDDAQAFIAWLNEVSGLRFRLPSESEWEYAARAGTTTSYYWGANFDNTRANSRGVSRRDQWDRLAPVGSFLPNGFGLFDMSGNAWEWTQDCYETSYATAPTDGSAWSSAGCERRVIRGGGWFADPAQLRSSDRDGGVPTVRINDLGFRLAMD